MRLSKKCEMEAFKQQEMRRAPADILYAFPSLPAAPDPSPETRHGVLPIT